MPTTKTVTLQKQIIKKNHYQHWHHHHHHQRTRKVRLNRMRYALVHPVLSFFLDLSWVQIQWHLLLLLLLSFLLPRTLSPSLREVTCLDLRHDLRIPRSANVLRQFIVFFLFNFKRWSEKMMMATMTIILVIINFFC